MKKINPSKSALKMHDDSSELRTGDDAVNADFLHTESDIQSSESMKRRKFLGMGLLGFAGLTLPLASKADGQNALENFVKGTIPFSDKTTSQTDGFDEKVKLLQEAWANKDFRIGRALANSLRISQIQAQAEQEDFGTALVGAGQRLAIL